MDSLSGIMQSLKLTPSPSRSPEPEPEVTLQNLPNHIKPPFAQIEHFPRMDILQRNFLDLLPREENTNGLTNTESWPRSSLGGPTSVQGPSLSIGAKSGSNRDSNAQRLQDLEGTNRSALLSEQRAQESLIQIGRISERTKKFNQTAAEILDERARERSERNLESGTRNAGKTPDRLSSFTLPEYQDDIGIIKQNLRIFLQHVAFNPSASAEQLVDLVRGDDAHLDFSAILQEIHTLGFRIIYDCSFEGLTNTIHELLTGLPRYEFRTPPMEVNPWHSRSPSTLATSPSSISTVSTLTEAPVTSVPSPPSVFPSATPMTTFPVSSNAPVLVPLVYSTNPFAPVAMPSSPPTASAVQYTPSAPPAPVPAAVTYSPWGIPTPSPNAHSALPAGLRGHSASASTFIPGVIPATSTSALTSKGDSSPPVWPEMPTTPLRAPVVKHEMMTPSSGSRSSSTSPSSVLSRSEPLKEQINTRSNPDFKTFMFTSSSSVKVAEPPSLKPTQVTQLGDLLFNKCPSANASYSDAQVWVYVNMNVSGDGTSVPGWKDITEVYGSLDLADVIRHPRDPAKYLTRNVNTGRPGWVTLDTVKKHIRDAHLKIK